MPLNLHRQYEADSKYDPAPESANEIKNLGQHPDGMIGQTDLGKRKLLADSLGLGKSIPPDQSEKLKKNRNELCRNKSEDYFLKLATSNDIFYLGKRMGQTREKAEVRCDQLFDFNNDDPTAAKQGSLSSTLRLG